MKLVLKFLQKCVEGRNKFEFFVSFVKMALSNTSWLRQVKFHNSVFVKTEKRR